MIASRFVFSIAVHHINFWVHPYPPLILQLAYRDIDGGPQKAKPETLLEQCPGLWRPFNLNLKVRMAKIISGFDSVRKPAWISYNPLGLHHPSNFVS